MSSVAVITEPKTVRVSAIHQTAPDLAVISFVENHEEKHNIYHVDSPAIMDNLLLTRAGKTVDAVLAPPNVNDGHPFCTAAHIVAE